MSRVNLGLHQPDASVVWDLGPHDFSIFATGSTSFLGDVGDDALVRAPGRAGRGLRQHAVRDGAIAHLELSWLSPSKLRRTTVIGSSKMVVYDDTSPEPVRIFDSGASLRDPESFGEFQLSYRTGSILSPRIDATEPLSLEIADFCAAILDGTPVRSSVAIGLDVVRSIEAVEDSLAAGGSTVSVSAPPVVRVVDGRTG